MNFEIRQLSIPFPSLKARKTCNIFHIQLLIPKQRKPRQSLKTRNPRIRRIPPDPKSPTQTNKSSSYVDGAHKADRLASKS
jgi:hypothetical protein